MREDTSDMAVLAAYKFEDLQRWGGSDRHFVWVEGKDDSTLTRMEVLTPDAHAINDAMTSMVSRIAAKMNSRPQQDDNKSTVAGNPDSPDTHQYL